MRPKYHWVPGVQLDSYETILNTYKLNRRLKRRRAAILGTEKPPLPPVNSNYILVFALFIQDLTSCLGGLQDGRGVGDVNFFWS